MMRKESKIAKKKSFCMNLYERASAAKKIKHVKHTVMWTFCATNRMKFTKFMCSNSFFSLSLSFRRSLLCYQCFQQRFFHHQRYSLMPFLFWLVYKDGERTVAMIKFVPGLFACFLICYTLDRNVREMTLAHKIAKQSQFTCYHTHGSHTKHKFIDWDSMDTRTHHSTHTHTHTHIWAKPRAREKKTVNGTIDVERNCGIVNIWLIGISSAIVPLHHYYSPSLVLFVNQFEYNFEVAAAAAATTAATLASISMVFIFKQP